MLQLLNKHYLVKGRGAPLLMSCVTLGKIKLIFAEWIGEGTEESCHVGETHVARI